MLSKSISSVIADRPNHEELPEIRAQQIKKILQQTMRRKSIERLPLTSRKREGNDDYDDIMKDKRVNMLMAPMDTIINKRKRFVKLDMDEERQVQSTQVKSI